MHTYLEQTKFAAEKIIDTYVSDFHKLNNQIKDFKEAGDWLVNWNKEMKERNLFDVMKDKDKFPAMIDEMGVMIAKARESSRLLFNLSDELKGREFATQVLCGSILQIAKQAISVAHSSLASCPDGRLIGTQPLKTVIWQGRNQAIHFEEGNPSEAVKTCFTALDNDLHTDLAKNLTSKSNLATHIVDILGWHSYKAYETDMISLVG